MEIHFLAGEAAAGTHRAVTGDGAANLFQPFLQRQRFIKFRKIVGQVADEARHVELAEDGRHLAHDDGAGAERLNHEAEFGEFASAGGKARRLGLVEFDHFGNQQQLTRNTARFHCLFHALIDEAFMGGMLVDDDE